MNALQVMVLFFLYGQYFSISTDDKKKKKSLTVYRESYISEIFNISSQSISVKDVSILILKTVKAFECFFIFFKVRIYFNSFFFFQNRNSYGWSRHENFPVLADIQNKRKRKTRSSQKKKKNIMLV